MRLPYNGNYQITQTFDDACCRASYAKFGMQGHNGIDYGLPCRTPVVAAFDGTIYSGNEPGGYGNYIFLRDAAGNEAVYGHLSQIQVGSGKVVEGQQIGLSGTTGNSSGCHLHFGYRPIGYNRSNGFLGYINPTFSKGDKDMATDAQIDEFIANSIQIAKGRPATDNEFNIYRPLLKNNFVEGATQMMKNFGIDTDTSYKMIQTYIDKFNQADNSFKQVFTQLQAVEKERDILKEQLANSGSGNPDDLIITRKGFNGLFDVLKNWLSKNN